MEVGGAIIDLENEIFTTGCEWSRQWIMEANKQIVITHQLMSTLNWLQHQLGWVVKIES